MVTKLVEIKSCTNCPHSMFDYDGGSVEFFGTYVCWHEDHPDEKVRESQLRSTS